MTSAENAKAKSEENPYLRARRIGADRAADLAGQIRFWQATAMLGLMMALAGVGGVIYFAAQGQYVPYVVEVSELGKPVMAGVMRPAGKVDERVVKHLLANWVCEARGVSFDPQIQRENYFRIYALLKVADPATAKIAAYLNDGNLSPSARMKMNVTVSVEIRSALPQSRQSWEVEWTEKSYSANSGEAVGEERWRGLFSIYVLPAKARASEMELARNPLNLFIKDFSWTKQG